MVARTRDRRAPPRRTAWCALALIAALLVPPAPATDSGLAAAVNIAGRQRMLTQRIVKAYCALALDVLPARSRRQLDEAVRTFEDQLAFLAALEVDSATRVALVRVQELWNALEPAATAAVDRERIAELARASDELLDASHALVLHLERAGGTPVARLVNVSGRQRMLSQRLAKLYFLRALGVGGEDLQAELERARDEFAASLRTLTAAPENTTAILEELNAVSLQWTWFEYAIGLHGARSFLLVVDDSSESILNSMEAITAMYEALATR